MQLAARTGAWAKSGGGMPTARDYVQDGLVFHIDAIENGGYGVHNNSFSTWKNLSTHGSVSDVSMNGEYEVYDDYVWTNRSAVNNTNGTCVGYADAILPRGDRTLEIIFKDIIPNGLDNNNRKNVFFIGPSSIPVIYLTLGQYWTTGNLPISVYSNRIDSGLANANVRIGNPYSISMRFPENSHWFLNALPNYDIAGAQYSADAFSGSLQLFNRQSMDRPFNGKFLSCRIYNRKLTDEESLANYAIDAARFNLT